MKSLERDLMSKMVSTNICYLGGAESVASNQTIAEQSLDLDSEGFSIKNNHLSPTH